MLYASSLFVFLNQDACVQKTSSTNLLSKNITKIKVKSSITKSSITTKNATHPVWHHNNAIQVKLSLFLPETDGPAERKHKKIFNTAISQRYPIINLCHEIKEYMEKVLTMIHIKICDNKFLVMEELQSNYTTHLNSTNYAKLSFY